MSRRAEALAEGEAAGLSRMGCSNECRSAADEGLVSVTGAPGSGRSIGIIGLAGLAAIVAGAYASPRSLAGRRRCSLPSAWASAGPISSAFPAKKTLAALIGLPGVGSAVAAAYVPAPGFLDWTPGLHGRWGDGRLRHAADPRHRPGPAARVHPGLAAPACCCPASGAGWIACSRFNGVREMLLVAAISAADRPAGRADPLAGPDGGSAGHRRGRARRPAGRAGVLRHRRVAGRRRRAWWWGRSWSASAGWSSLRGTPLNLAGRPGHGPGAGRPLSVPWLTS